MPRYIDADALKEEVGQIAFIWVLGRALGKTLLRKAVNDYTNAVIAKIDNMAAADVVGVVRCKDCKWFNDFGCAIRIIDESDNPKEDDFCSFGERRE